ncbi:hypothetical protein A0H81_06276 [Grifola frondosa]|uniref:RING-type domain-containing protein n=1 Tax=Grifola frondosa TaxID=5627 RepID=A0A1C7M9S2_GRIFR|nr:hypothetical protein A0H81_06276 [Grifola frondosa]
MEALTCGICLDELKIPVSPPCGHLHCEQCLFAHIEAGADAMEASCPTCRTSFHTASPDLRFVPKKYHNFMVPSVRRVFIEVDADAQSSTTALKARVAKLDEQVNSLRLDKAMLMERCEANISASRVHAEGEKNERLAKEKLQEEVQELRRKYENMKDKYRGLKAANEASTPRLKRKSSDALLDGSSSVVAGPSQISDPMSVRGTLGFRPFAKRPRLLASPFDLSKPIPSSDPLRRVHHPLSLSTPAYLPAIFSHQNVSDSNGSVEN